MQDAWTGIFTKIGSARLDQAARLRAPGCYQGDALQLACTCSNPLHLLEPSAPARTLCTCSNPLHLLEPARTCSNLLEPAAPARTCSNLLEPARTCCTCSNLLHLLEPAKNTSGNI